MPHDGSSSAAATKPSPAGVPMTIEITAASRRSEGRRSGSEDEASARSVIASREDASRLMAKHPMSGLDR